mgnify:CR=1 FL=1
MSGAQSNRNLSPELSAKAPPQSSAAAAGVAIVFPVQLPAQGLPEWQHGSSRHGSSRHLFEPCLFVYNHLIKI